MSGISVFVITLFTVSWTVSALCLVKAFRQGRDLNSYPIGPKHLGMGLFSAIYVAWLLGFILPNLSVSGMDEMTRYFLLFLQVSFTIEVVAKYYKKEV